MPRTPDCHPDRKYFAKGFCESCYYKQPKWVARRHRREVMEAAKLRASKYYWENRETCLSKQKARYDLNPEPFLQRNRRWKSENMTTVLNGIRIRKLRKKSAGGKHSVSEWDDLRQSFDHACLGCFRREPQVILYRDHVLPIVRGGTDFIDNIQPLCRSCNSSKGTNFIDLRTQFNKPTI